MTSTKRDKVVGNAARAIINECVDAMDRYPRFNSAHEGYAVLLEELDELKAEVWKSPKNRDPQAMQEEAIQVGAMALRFLVDVCQWE